MKVLAFPGLAIQSPLISPTSANFSPTSWPPPRDWPVTIDANGCVVSRWGDPVWVLDAWAQKRCVLNFGDGQDSGKASSIDRVNADILRTVTSWWLYGVHGMRSAKTLQLRFNTLRPMFAFCSKQGIAATDLNRYPLVAERLHTVFMPSGSEMVLSLLHELHAFSSDIGFELLGQQALARLAAALPSHNTQQTPYIPPRIWKYQLSRLRECLDDFLENKTSVESLFEYCLNAYVHNYGSLEEATRIRKNPTYLPFIAKYKGQYRNGRFHPGTFEAAADRFGIATLLNKWVGISSARALAPLTVDLLSRYFTLISWAGIGYLLNFTLMRSDEAMTLQDDCLKFDEDPRFGRIYLIEGGTSKTFKDDTARWVTSESSCIAVEALTAVTALRRQCKPTTGHRLIQHPTEPWASGILQHDERNRLHPLPYAKLIERFPLLFDLEQLRITPHDLELARLATPTLDASFQVGAIWPLGWHQLRRTGAVNMQASGLVSDSSLQFQLKHLSRVMSLYYGQNHAQVRLEESARAFYVQTMYETLGRELQTLASERFVSPHGSKRKEELVRVISLSDLKQSVQLAKRGGVACREIVLGACMNREPCTYGGIESVAHCGGGDSDKPCPEVLYDRSKASQVEHLDRLLTERLSHAPTESPLHEALSAQKRSVLNYFSTIKTTPRHYEG